MSAATIISQAFGQDANLYTTVLQLPSDDSVTPSQLRKAYYRQALKYHPDKQSDKSEEEIADAKLKFQAISVAYAILSDEDRRHLYDESGEMDDSEEGLDQSNTDAWKDYFKGIFGKVTSADIDKFTESYKCSEEEEKDVLKYYSQFKGDLNKMLECVMCSNEIDKSRWVQDYIQPAIKKNFIEDYVEEINRTLGDNTADEVIDNGDDDDDDTETETEGSSDDEGTDASGKQKGKKRKAAAKSKPKPSKKKKGKKKADNGISANLIAAIRGKPRTVGQQGYDCVIAGLEERYASKGRSKKGGKKKAPMEDIPDDEFEKIQKRLESQRRMK